MGCGVDDGKKFMQKNMGKMKDYSEKMMSKLNLSDDLKNKFQDFNITYYQSNIEGQIIDKLHEVGFHIDGIVLNAAAYTHTSVGIGDAVASITSPVIEVHISNTYAREDFRHISYISPNAKGVVLGFGLKSYELALSSFR